MNCASDELWSRWKIAGPKIAEYLKKVESKILKDTNHTHTHNHEHNPIHNVMFRKDYTIVVGDCSQSIHSWRICLSSSEENIVYSEELRAFVDSILKVHSQ